MSKHVVVTVFVAISLLTPSLSRADDSQEPSRWLCKAAGVTGSFVYPVLMPLISKTLANSFLFERYFRGQDKAYWLENCLDASASAGFYTSLSRVAFLVSRRLYADRANLFDRLHLMMHVLHISPNLVRNFLNLAHLDDVLRHPLLPGQPQVVQGIAEQAAAAADAAVENAAAA